MSSASPRVGLTVMADSDFVNPAVVDGNCNKLDLITSVQRALSGARPTPPFDGQHIYETDTQNFRRYDKPSASWYLLGSGPNGTAAQGLIGSFSNTSAATITGDGSPHAQDFQAASMLDYNFNVLANRNYKIVEQGWFNVSGSAPLSESLIMIDTYTVFNLGSNPPLNSNIALSYYQYWYNRNKFGQRNSLYKVMNYSSGTAGTLYLRSLVRTDASLWVNTAKIGRPADTIGSYAWVYDMGPNGSSY